MQVATTDAAAGAWLSIHPDGGASYTPLLSVQPERARGALGASLASHGVFVLILFLALQSAPPEEIVAVERTIYDSIIWIPQEGPGGGGGGGGNESLEMPREVEVAGEDDINIPIEEPEEFVVPPEVSSEPEEQPLEAQHTVQLSAVPMAAAPRTRSGVLQGLMARSLDSAGSGTGGGAGEGAGGGIGPGQGDGLGPGVGGGSGGGVYRPGNGVETPQPLRQVRPNYTSEAMRAKIQGEVIIEAVVLPDGTVGDVKIVRSLDTNFGLDEEAVKAARQWRFRPGTRFGDPVAVLVTIALTFTLR
ncbi:MAG TPA: hypothetical protein DEQ98_02870 [Acidobacteria bacterium]|nr:hypothetical protein [Acidobacteriota bacterium]